MLTKDFFSSHIHILQSILDLRKSSAPTVRVSFRFYNCIPYYYFFVGVSDERLKQNRLIVSSFTDAVLVAKGISFAFGASCDDLSDVLSFDDFNNFSALSVKGLKNESDRQ